MLVIQGASGKLGYAVAPSRQGRGLATAAVAVLVERARLAGVRVVSAHTLAVEGPSPAVLRRSGAARVVLAVPVAPADTVEAMRAVADEVVCLLTPSRFRAVGAWYDDFGEVGDGEVARLLEAAGPGAGAHPA